MDTKTDRKATRAALQADFEANGAPAGRVSGVQGNFDVALLREPSTEAQVWGRRTAEGGGTPRLMTRALAEREAPDVKWRGRGMTPPGGDGDLGEKVQARSPGASVLHCVLWHGSMWCTVVDGGPVMEKGVFGCVSGGRPPGGGGASSENLRLRFGRGGGPFSEGTVLVVGRPGAKWGGHGAKHPMWSTGGPRIMCGLPRFVSCFVSSVDHVLGENVKQSDGSYARKPGSHPVKLLHNLYQNRHQKLHLSNRLLLL